MEEEKKYTRDEAIKALAAGAFNKAWEYMDKKDRTDEDNDAMLAATFAQRHLWEKVGTPLNVERADWQISRVYAVLGKGSESLHFAKNCLVKVEENGIGDFDLPFAHEAMARAYALLSDKENCQRHYELGIKALDGVKDEGDKDYALSELNSIQGLDNGI